MTNQSEPLAARVQNSFLELSEVASDLNAVSDELGKSVSEIDAALKTLNLGIEVWVTIKKWEGVELDYYYEQIGYAKVDGKWGISIRTIDGNHNYPDQDSIEKWLFNDGPRRLRLAGIQNLPEVLKDLSEKSAATVKEIKGRLSEVKEVAAAVKNAAEATAPQKKRLIDLVREGAKK